MQVRSQEWSQEFRDDGTQFRLCPMARDLAPVQFRDARQASGVYCIVDCIAIFLSCSQEHAFEIYGLVAGGVEYGNVLNLQSHVFPPDDRTYRCTTIPALRKILTLAALANKAYWHAIRARNSACTQPKDAD